MFVTTQPVLLNYSHNKKSFKKLLKENINNIRNIYNFEYYSFTEIKNELNLKNINNAFIYHSKSILNHLIDKENNMFLTERKTNKSNTEITYNSLIFIIIIHVHVNTR
ncbi:hypothetical protein U3516DRAFT_662507 [Neocallimastix sp. 'constans']